MIGIQSSLRTLYFTRADVCEEAALIADASSGPFAIRRQTSTCYRRADAEDTQRYYRAEQQDNERQETRRDTETEHLVIF